MRTWAHSVSKPYALQTSPGQYNEAIFRGLDYVIAQARLTGIRVWTQSRVAYTFCKLACRGISKLVTWMFAMLQQLQGLTAPCGTCADLFAMPCCKHVLM